MKKRVGLPAVVAAAGFAGLMGAPAGPVGIDEASAVQPGRWVGTTHGGADRSSRWASGGSLQKGNFWFTVDRRGNVTGEAVVAYTPNFNADGLNALIGYARGLGQATLGLVPYFGGFGAAALNSFVGVKVSYKEPFAIRTGRLTGTLKDARLQLNWVGRPDGIPFTAKITRTRAEDEKPLTSGKLVVDSPFDGKAGQVEGGHAVSIQRSRSKDGSVTETNSSYWTAHRVGGR